MQLATLRWAGTRHGGAFGRATRLRAPRALPPAVSPHGWSEGAALKLEPALEPPQLNSEREVVRRWLTDAAVHGGAVEAPDLGEAAFGDLEIGHRNGSSHADGRGAGALVPAELGGGGDFGSQS
jgi:hypothetical protein